MKATIDLPDDVCRRVKARSAEEGRRIREVAAELFRNWLDGESGAAATLRGRPGVGPRIETFRQKMVSNFADRQGRRSGVC